MNEQAINEIKDALRELIQLLVNRDEPLSEEMKVHLAQVIEHAGERIQQLRNAPIESPIQQLPLEPGPFESSQVNSYNYNPDTKDLLIKFHGKDSADSGPTYKYNGIPKFIFDQFIKGAVPPMTSGSNQYHTWQKGVTPSLGASLNRLIKATGFPYERLS